MMRILFILLFSPTAADPAMVELRRQYYSASTGKKAADEFLLKMKAADVKNSPVLLAYQAMAYLLQAKNGLNPYSKISNFNKGKTLLEQAVSKSPQSTEIRFLRFSVQTNAPFFLGYSKQIDADKAVILQHWKNLADADLKSRIKDFMLNSTYCNDHDKSAFR